MKNTLPLKSYYQFSYVSVRPTGILLTIVNILMKDWNVHFHLALDWSNAAWPMWWLKQSIKLCKLNESVVSVTKTSCVYLLACFWVSVLLFEGAKIQSFTSPTLALNYTKATLRYFKGTSWRRCYLVIPSCLIHTYFTSQGSFLLIYKQELKSGKVFSPSQLTCDRTSLCQDMTWSMFVNKSWSVNSDWLTLLVRSKVTRGVSFNNRLY